jgi:photosystem I P700 chlorophyll a apoprotein A2
LVHHISGTVQTERRFATPYSRSYGQCATARLFDFVGNIHDIEAYQGLSNNLAITQYLFATHWGHLSVIFLWVSGTLFHIGWTGNFVLWRSNPVATIAISHPVWDPHFYVSADTGTYLTSTPSYCGVYNWLLSVGFTNEQQIYYLVIAMELLSLVFMLLGKLHISRSLNLTHWMSTYQAVSGFTHRSHSYSVVDNLSKIPLRFYCTYLESNGTRLNFHLASLFGAFSSIWAGHIVHVAIPASRGSSINIFSFSDLALSLGSGHWNTYSAYPDALNHVFGSELGVGTALLTFLGGLNGTTEAIALSDIAHHHLALGVLIIWSAHLYASLYRGIGSRLSEILSASGVRLVTKFVIKSLHLQLSLALICLSITVSVVAHQMYSMPAYPYINYDYVTTVALYVHHNWIASFAMVGSFAHASLFLIRDYVSSGSVTQDLFARLVYHKSSIISHLSWVSLFLGFHTLGVYVHNDVVVAFGEPYKQLLLEPIIAQTFSEGWFYAIKSYGYLGTSIFELSSLKPGLLKDFMASSLGAGDYLAYHSVSLGLHVTSLILIKGALDSQGTSLMPDKVHFGYGFACDGPARGGTCDISSWDAFYLAFFWALNSNSWLMFFFHWKHLLGWQALTLKFEESSTFLNGWFRDYLWFNSAALIRGYDFTGSNDLSVWSWTFLAAHLCWATGFMFLISWRGYWQELLDIILYMHLKTPFLYDLWDGRLYSPVALSIVQARFIGLVHFSVGLIVTYAAFVLGATT